MGNGEWGIGNWESLFLFPSCLLPFASCLLIIYYFDDIAIFEIAGTVKYDAIAHF
jgi:hypothetical protein